MKINGYYKFSDDVNASLQPANSNATIYVTNAGGAAPIVTLGAAQQKTDA
jgi:hypothetical protein